MVKKRNRLLPSSSLAASGQIPDIPMQVSADRKGSTPPSSLPDGSLDNISLLSAGFLGKSAASPEIPLGAAMHVEAAGEISPSISVTLGSKDTCSSEDNTFVDTFKSNADSEIQKSDSWAQKVKLNRKIDEGFSLSKVEPQPEEILFDDSDLIVEESAWGPSLVGYFVGPFPGFAALQRIRKGWNVNCRFTKHNSGWIVFRFDCEFDRDSVLAGGPYFAYSRPLVLKLRPKFFEADSVVDHCTVPVWVKLPNLPLELWSESGLSKMASKIGYPISSDALTKSRMHCDFARVLVEVDASKELVRFIKLKLPNGKLREQPVVYELEPKYCLDCKALGHGTQFCAARKASMQGKAKAKVNAPKAAMDGGIDSQVPGSSNAVGSKVSPSIPDPSQSIVAAPNMHIRFPCNVDLDPEQPTGIPLQPISEGMGTDQPAIDRETAPSISAVTSTVEVSKASFTLNVDDSTVEHILESQGVSAADSEQPTVVEEVPFITVTRKAKAKKVVAESSKGTAPKKINHNSKNKNSGRAKTLPKSL